MFQCQACLYILITLPYVGRLFSYLISICLFLFQYLYMFLKYLGCSIISIIFLVPFIQGDDHIQGDLSAIVFQYVLLISILYQLHCVRLTVMDSFLREAQVFQFLCLHPYLLLHSLMKLPQKVPVEVKLLCHYVLGSASTILPYFIIHPRTQSRFLGRRYFFLKMLRQCSFLKSSQYCF